MNNLYINILKSFLDLRIYNEYKDLIDSNYLKDYLPELYKLFNVLPTLHESTSDDNPCRTPVDLEVTFYAVYPSSSPELYKPLSEELARPAAEQVLFYLGQCRERDAARTLAQAAIDVSEGRKPFEDLRNLLPEQGEVAKGDEDEFITTNLVELCESTIKAQGFRWRLESLNKSLGSLRTGDFGFVVARPETGKTTFLASEVSYFAGQESLCDTRPILWINNEEQGGKVMFRLFQAGNERTQQDILKDVSQLGETPASKSLQRVKVYDAAGKSTKELEKVIKKLNPCMIVIDQLDKVKGHSNDRYDLEMKALYQWARELAKKYGPVIGVCQAGGTGENKKWITMNDVDSSKTAKQGEADWILGIGKIEGEDTEYIRYLHLSKNKLQGDTDTDPTRRHDRWSCLIKPEVARYEDF
jgi:replicative DNA helicase